MPREHRILVTGASGFVGSWLLHELNKRRLELGTELTVLTAGQSDVSDWKTEIADREQVATLIRDCRPTAIIHLAAIAAPGDARKMPQRAWDVNFQGTMNLAYAVMEYAPEARFVFVGSSEALLIYRQACAQRTLCRAITGYIRYAHPIPIVAAERAMHALLQYLVE